LRARVLGQCVTRPDLPGPGVDSGPGCGCQLDLDTFARVVTIAKVAKKARTVAVRRRPRAEVVITDQQWPTSP
jgi:hypothetical protein